MGYKSKREKITSNKAAWHKTFCRACGGITNQVIMGNVHRITIKSGNHFYCKAGALIKLLKKKKLKLSAIKSKVLVRTGEAVPASAPCTACHERMKEVEAGGVLIECAECQKIGVLPAKSKEAKYYRVRDAVLAPKALIIKFEKCEQHENTDVPRIEV